MHCSVVGYIFAHFGLAPGPPQGENVVKPLWVRSKLRCPSFRPSDIFHCLETSLGSLWDPFGPSLTHPWDPLGTHWDAKRRSIHQTGDIKSRDGSHVAPETNKGCAKSQKDNTIHTPGRKKTSRMEALGSRIGEFFEIFWQYVFHDHTQ